MKRLILAAALALSCGHVKPAPTGACGDICKHIAELGCKWADKCADLCPTIAPAVLECVGRAESCAQADRCDE